MEKIEKFEDIVAWRKARELVRTSYQVTQERAGFKRDLPGEGIKSSPTS
jgi:hypothetical protein